MHRRMDTGGKTEAARSLLIVEDEVELGQVLEQHFSVNGFRVRRVGNGADGLRMIMEEDFDAILCDMVMPKMPGDMFYYAVQRVKPDLCERFIFITGYGESPGIRDFLTKVSEQVIKKPFNLEDLTDALRQLFADLDDRSRRLDMPEGATPIRPLSPPPTNR
jgi:DNA-binding NtrC family response regulator